MLLKYMKASAIPERRTSLVKTLCLGGNSKYLLEFRNTVNPTRLEGLKLYTWWRIFPHSYFPPLRNASRGAFPTSCKGTGEVSPSPPLLAKALLLGRTHTSAHPQSPLPRLGYCYTALKHALNKIFHILRSCLLKFTIMSSWNSLVLSLCRLTMPYQRH